MTRHFHVGRMQEAAELVERFHYSGRVPANVQVVGTWHEDGGLFGDYGPAIAACFFTIPAARRSEDVLELARLVRRDNVSVPLTGLIAQTCRFIRTQRLAHLLVSFADTIQNHHGGIYQAASWTYAGRRKAESDGILLDGSFIHARTCNHMWGTRSPDKLRERMPDRSVEYHFDEGKHLYWRALTAEGKRRAKRLGFGMLPYPKPERETA